MNIHCGWFKISIILFVTYTTYVNNQPKPINNQIYITIIGFIVKKILNNQ